MRIEYAFLADSAQVSRDGKLYALGAGIDRIFAERLPVTHTYMSLVVRLRLHPMECDRSHHLEIEMWDPDGGRLGPKLETDFRVGRDEKEPSRDRHAQMVLNFYGVEFPREGDYAFHIAADGNHLGHLELFVRKVDEPARESGGHAEGTAD